MMAFMDVRLWKKLTAVLTAEPEISVQAENKCAVLVQHRVFVHSLLATKTRSFSLIINALCLCWQDANPNKIKTRNHLTLVFPQELLRSFPLTVILCEQLTCQATTNMLLNVSTKPHMLFKEAEGHSKLYFLLLSLLHKSWRILTTRTSGLAYSMRRQTELLPRN